MRNAQNARESPKELNWPLWPLVPIYPYSQRRTLRHEIVSDSVWTFDQLQGIFYVTVPIRMTVIKLDEGGLLVYAPVAPTRECLRLVNELVAKYGDVKYIVFPTSSGLEHKVFVGPFARHFPHAQVYIPPHQWSFPFDLPLSWLGFPKNRTDVLPSEASRAPFASQFDYSILGPIDLGTGTFEEVALFDRRSRTLLLTDSIVSVPENPPAIVQYDPYPLLFHAKDTAFDDIEDSVENRRKGWHRICLFAFYFRPSVLETLNWGEVFRNALKAKDRSKRGYFGLFPFLWKENWTRSFEALRENGRPFVAPVLQTLILNRAPRETLDWADRVACWGFDRIVPCHFDAPIAANPQQFREAFSFLEKFPRGNCTLPETDLQLLRDIDARLNRSGLVPPAKEKV
ncbi:MAG: DUF4336 domain-containing protein [Cyanobacteria bacterium SBC]|nr:DUF4336 domain-containing protein [Cyanobacteria bacterium SBC]